MSFNTHTLPKFVLLIFCYILIFATSCKDKQENTLEKTSTDLTEKEAPTSNATILFFGNSLTAGLGLDPDDAFPALIQNKIDSLSLDYIVVNAGLSGDTTASGKNRLEWALNDGVEIMILELGANDGLRGIPLDETEANLQEMINMAKTSNQDIKIILAGMQIPPNMGPEYTEQFKNIYPKLAEKNSIPLIPFLLQDVAGIPELNQNDGIHPTEEGQKIVANNVWEVLKTELSQ
ncbi:arylesterase [Aegicerativicinus sediminis]|uniref:arylesterase n=1 Tax=Aegicerativicinus sediminis TaxID=2893202 RepID=UPI001E3C8617|nr:arylesterase [Aegicerativicinus sediminis]